MRLSRATAVEGFDRMPRAAGERRRLKAGAPTQKARPKPRLLVGAPGFEPGTPCSQIICKEGECAQFAHFPGEDADISVHQARNVCNLRTFVSVIVSVLT